MALLPRVLELLRAQGQGHVAVLVGGIIPDDDLPELRRMGVAHVFGPGSNTGDILKAFREAISASQKAG
jgi:methylmalonyl-CoA mutase C-terminal domain/subunit